MDFFFDKQPKRRNMDLIFGTWNARRSYKAGSLVSVSKGMTDTQ
jgi:hypothetical protein